MYSALRELFEYDAWATGRLLEAVATLSPEQFTRELASGAAGDLSSVRQQFVHLVLVMDRYRYRLAGETGEVPDVAPESFATPQELVAYEAQVRERLAMLIEHLPQERLDEVQEMKTRYGPFRVTRRQTLQHMVNHATYHRGQVAFALKLQGVQFEDTDFILYVNRA